MLIVFSITGGGAGDVKFAGCLGALFGIRTGLDALITGYVIGAAVIGAIAIVKFGPIKLFMLAFRTVGCRLAPQWIHGPAPADRKLMLTQVPLGPFFAAGAFVSLYRVMMFDRGLFI
jgi:prepilin signal peptidase PulO-like enzyme (type II secretory pathway)